MWGGGGGGGGPDKCPGCPRINPLLHTSRGGALVLVADRRSGVKSPLGDPWHIFVGYTLVMFLVVRTRCKTVVYIENTRKAKQSAPSSSNYMV